MITKNLSKSRFILYLSVVLFMFLILIIQFIVLSVYRVKAQNLQERLDQIEKEKEQSENEQNLNSCYLDFSYIDNGETLQIFL